MAAASTQAAGVKPALKHDDDGPASGSKSKKARVGGIKWDEPTIAEHDKERGTRMKIDEPDTPFNHSKMLLAQAAQDQAASSKAHGSGLRGDKNIRSTDWAADAASVASDAELAALGDSDDEAAEPADGGGTFVGGPVDIQHVKQFSKARSQHYNEFQRMKEMREKGLLDEDEDDDEDDSTSADGGDGKK